MNQRSTHYASAKQPTELDLPQYGSEAEVETCHAEFAGNLDKAESKIAETLDTKEATFQPNPKNQLCADPVLPRTTQPTVTPNSVELCTINGYECVFPGPSSRDDDEDSSPLLQDLDLADHVPCSNRNMTTSGHDSTETLTYHGFLLATQSDHNHLSGSTESWHRKPIN